MAVSSLFDSALQVVLREVTHYERGFPYLPGNVRTRLARVMAKRGLLHRGNMPLVGRTSSTTLCLPIAFLTVLVQPNSATIVFLTVCHVQCIILCDCGVPSPPLLSLSSTLSFSSSSLPFPPSLSLSVLPSLPLFNLSSLLLLPLSNPPSLPPSLPPGAP